MDGKYIIAAPSRKLHPMPTLFVWQRAGKRYTWGMLSAQLTLYTAQPTTLIDSERQKQKSRLRGPGHWLGLGNILQIFIWPETWPNCSLPRTSFNVIDRLIIFNWLLKLYLLSLCNLFCMKESKFWWNGPWPIFFIRLFWPKCAYLYV